LAVAWVHDAAVQSGAQQVIVAVDDARVARAAGEFGAEVEMTRADHASGTDRIAEVAQRRGWSSEEIVINLQGDEPSMPATLVRQVGALLERHPGAAIATLAFPIRTLEEMLDPNCVKVVADEAGRALYFSRAPIPFARG
jgi:3-deoxy-manno-octulosonate cytidylyltransferase (CMP-KDO synthetase)